MNVKELKIHILRGLIRPEYFYIPLFEKKSGVFIRVTDQNGEPVYIRKISFTYRTYQLWHAVYKDGSSWVTARDETSKGYAFDADTQWTWPPAIPNPSAYQILPVPDFTSNTPEIDGGEVTELSSQYIVFTFEETKNLIELKNFPAGIYYVSVSSADVVYDAEKYKINKIEYFPTYYNDYERSVSHTSGSCQIDKSGRFSGFDMSENADSTDHHPTGYDFYCLSQKFKNNTMPIVCSFSYINITSESNIAVYFRLLNPYDSSDVILQSGFSQSSDIGACYWQGYATRDELSDVDTFEMTLTDIDSASDNIVMTSGYVRSSASYSDPNLFTETTAKTDSTYVYTVTIAEPDSEIACDPTLFRPFSEYEPGKVYDALYINNIQPGRYRLSETGNNRFARVHVTGSKSDALREMSDTLLQMETTVTMQEVADEILSTIPEGDVFIETVKEQYDNIEFEVYKEHLWGDLYITKLRIPESRRGRTYDDLEAGYYIAESTLGSNFFGTYNRYEKKYMDEYQFSSDGTYYVRNYIENNTVKNEIHVIHNVPKVDFKPALVDVSGMTDDAAVFAAIKIYVDDQYQGYFTCDMSGLDRDYRYTLLSEADIDDLSEEKSKHCGADGNSIPYTRYTIATYGTSATWFPVYIRGTDGSYGAWPAYSSYVDDRVWDEDIGNIILGDGLTDAAWSHYLDTRTEHEDSWDGARKKSQQLKRQYNVPERWSTYHNN